MKTYLLRLLLTATLAFAALPSAHALMTYHHREHLSGSGWSEGLTALINDPARVSGQIGPFGPTARFHYSGDVTVLNKLLTQYAAISGQSHILYLEAEAPPAIEGFKDGESHDFDLSVNQTGEGFLQLYTLGRIRLEDLQIPAGVSVELLPSATTPLDPTLQAKAKAEHDRVAAFVAAHKAK